MGFGYLLIGYLCTFVLYLTVANLGIGGAALLVGYVLMMYGLRMLNLYHKDFVWAKWLTVPLTVTAVYALLQSLDELFLWGLPIFNDITAAVYQWVTFALLIVFQLGMLFGIRMIAGEVGLPHIATKAVRNSFLVALYALLDLVANLPVAAIREIQPYLAVPVILTNVVMVACNLLLLISCNKNICRAGDEDQPAKPSRFAFINRIGEAYERTRQKSVDNARQEAEAALRRRQEKQSRKNSKKKKK